jgi:hypothetical protein
MPPRHRGPARAEGEVSAEGSSFKWRCGTCNKVLAAPDLETLQLDVLDHIREAGRRGVTEPRCGHCREPISEASLEQHTTYVEDADTPLCGILRLWLG